MCTAFTHAFVAASLGFAWFPRTKAWPVRWLAPVLSAVPDLDYGLHAFGVQYGDLPEFVDAEYVARVARVNAVALAATANVRSIIVNRNPPWMTP